MPIPNHGISVDNRDDEVDDDIPMDDGGSSNISESLDGTTIPIANPPSTQYVTPLSGLWILRQRTVWRPAAHPLIYGSRFTKGRFKSEPTPLNVG
jgi:hypothetical protein